MAKQRENARLNDNNISSTHPMLCPDGEHRPGVWPAYA